MVHQRAILEQLEDAGCRGLALRLSTSGAAHHFPHVTINSLAGIAKMSDKGEVAGVRLVRDGTHGVGVNRTTRQRDQDGCPVAAVVRRVQREQSLSSPAAGLALVVRVAHRLPRGASAGLGVPGMQLGPLACYLHFRRRLLRHVVRRLLVVLVGGARVRAAHLLALPENARWLLLFADDLKAESTSARPQRAIIFVVVLLVVLGVPL